MKIVARMVTQEQDGIPGYMAHPEGPGSEDRQHERHPAAVAPPLAGPLGPVNVT
jgi:hypothetical protein